MTNTYQGFYGSGNTPCDIFTMESNDGIWYAVDGSCTVNLAPYDTEFDGINVEEIQDLDAFTWPDGINSEDELEFAVNE
jgi:hypothetical protein